MDDLKRMIVILQLLKKVNREVGKTFIQKSIYLLQEGLKENLDYDYKLHFYGPFSQELADDIDTLEDLGLINVDYNPEGYGYQIRVTEEGISFLNRFQTQYGIEEEKLEKVLNLISGEFVTGMELLGTVLYFAKLTNDEDEIKKLVNMVKPYFPEREISEALERLKKEGLI